MSQGPTTRDDPVTVAALAIAAAAIVTMDHEAIGHGSACLMLGGHIERVTSVYFDCSVKSAWIAIAGPAGNLVAGLLAWCALKLLPAGYSRLRLLLLLVMALSFFWEAGYLFYAMVLGEGDWFIAMRALLGDALQWRVCGFAFGALLYFVAIRATAFAARPFTVPQDDGTGRDRVRSLLRLSWLAAGVAACAAAAFYAPDRLSAMRQGALEIGAASLPLLIMSARVRSNSARVEGILKRDPAWLFFAGALFAVFVATLGRGLY